MLNRLLLFSLWYKKTLKIININPVSFLLSLRPGYQLCNSRLVLCWLLKLHLQTLIGCSVQNFPPANSQGLDWWGSCAQLPHPWTLRFHGHYHCIPWHSFPVRPNIWILTNYFVTSSEMVCAKQPQLNGATTHPHYITTTARGRTGRWRRRGAHMTRFSHSLVPFPTERLHRSSYRLIILLKGSCF